MYNYFMYVITADIVAKFQDFLDMVDCIKAMFRKVLASHGCLPFSLGL